MTDTMTSTAAHDCRIWQI